MAAPSYYVFDGDPTNSITPRRPGIDDVGGAAFIDDQAYPPDPETMPNADSENQNEKLAVGYGKVCPVAILDFEFSGGTPAITRMTAPGFNLEAADFTVTDSGNGNTLIEWDADTLPPPVAKPRAFVNESGPFCVSAIPGTNSVRVRTWSNTGTATDASFTVDIY